MKVPQCKPIIQLQEREERREKEVPLTQYIRKRGKEPSFPLSPTHSFFTLKATQDSETREEKRERRSLE